MDNRTLAILTTIVLSGALLVGIILNRDLGAFADQHLSDSRTQISGTSY